MQVTSEESTCWSGLPLPQPATYLILGDREQERSLKEFGKELRNVARLRGEFQLLDRF
jgi:hypothetical protein